MWDKQSNKKTETFSIPCGGAVCLLSCVCSYENCFHTKAYCTMPFLYFQHIKWWAWLSFCAPSHYHNVRPKRHRPIPKRPHFPFSTPLWMPSLSIHHTLAFTLFSLPVFQIVFDTTKKYNANPTCPFESVALQQTLDYERQQQKQQFFPPHHTIIFLTTSCSFSMLCSYFVLLQSFYSFLLRESVAFLVQSCRFPFHPRTLCHT